MRGEEKGDGLGLRLTTFFFRCSMKWLSEAALYIMYTLFLYSSGGDGGGIGSGTQGEPLST